MIHVFAGLQGAAVAHDHVSPTCNPLVDFDIVGVWTPRVTGRRSTSSPFPTTDACAFAFVVDRLKGTERALAVH